DGQTARMTRVIVTADASNGRARSLSGSIASLIRGTLNARYTFPERSALPDRRRVRNLLRPMMRAEIGNGGRAATRSRERKLSASARRKPSATLTFFFTAVYTRSRDAMN